MIFKFFIFHSVHSQSVTNFFHFALSINFCYKKFELRTSLLFCSACRTHWQLHSSRSSLNFNSPRQTNTTLEPFLLSPCCCLLLLEVKRLHNLSVNDKIQTEKDKPGYDLCFVASLKCTPNLNPLTPAEQEASISIIFYPKI